MSPLPPSPRVFTSEDVLICVITAAIGGVMAWYVYHLGLMTSLTDQSSHLNFSRLTFDSLTPGISQIGFWPPLLHVLMIPFVAVPALFSTGLAGAFVLIPALCIAAVFLYRICVLLTDNRLLGVVATVLFLLNPFILYYSVTPMMEMLFTANIFGAAYFTGLWIRYRRIEYLLVMGIFVSLACLSRYEGLILLPITGSIVLTELLRQRKSYAEMEAIVLLFGLLAVIGVTFILIYSTVYGGSPLTFSGGDWIRDPQASLRLAKYSVFRSVLYNVFAAFYMIGKPLFFASVLSAPALFFVQKRRFLVFAVLITLLAPLLFVLMATFMGSITINLPDLPPYKFFNNDRYGLTWIGFAILSPILLLEGLKESVEKNRSLYTIVFLGMIATFSALVSTGAYALYDTTITKQYSVIRDDVNSPLPEQKQVAEFLHAHYDGGKILSARVDNDPIFAEAGIAYDNYIYEGNFLYFNQALREPWLFARWVIMHNPDKSGDDWARQSEPVYKQWGNSDEFKHYYTLAYENKYRQVYKLNESVIRAVANDQGFVIAAVPSLSNRATWNPSTVYAEMRAPEDIRVKADALANSPQTVVQGMQAFYENSLKPEYAKGYVADYSGNGNSESQSYALLQALWAGDQATFDHVWQWTKSHTRRPDGLFSWKFSINARSNAVHIDDSNSATDADTDIAYALLQASTKWSKPEYAQDALRTLGSIWALETATDATNKRHMLAGTWANQEQTLVINPSYIAPYAYRLFASVDQAHPWNELIDTGYEDIARASAIIFPDKPKEYLPPNWIAIRKDTGEMIPFGGKSDGLDYSYDSFRTFWRIALDDMTGNASQAKAYLSKITIFDTEWKKNNRICSVYVSPLRDTTEHCYFNRGTLAGPLAIWSTLDRPLAKDMLTTYYFPSGSVELPAKTAFYEKSWYWFSLWLWTQKG